MKDFEIKYYDYNGKQQNDYDYDSIYVIITDNLAKAINYLKEEKDVTDFNSMTYDTACYCGAGALVYGLRDNNVGYWRVLLKRDIIANKIAMESDMEFQPESQKEDVAIKLNFYRSVGSKTSIISKASIIETNDLNLTCTLLKGYGYEVEDSDFHGTGVIVRDNINFKDMWRVLTEYDEMAINLCTEEGIEPRN